ncbi:uncharacterized protein LOC131182955 [Hevea brasiliensis]|uniref:uncharacterized protein LOC131182955 n=1 Tax=Hevea brasiliensis TaxID=3981 RepID=UPI0025E9D96C|nr:uncharacterized protein LOC131182955 [Hevea brasiliensis]
MTSEPVQEKGSKKKKTSKAPIVLMERAIHEPRNLRVDDAESDESFKDKMKEKVYEVIVERDFGISLENEKLRTNMIPITSLQKDDDGRKLRFEQGVRSKSSARGAFNVEGILKEVNNLRSFQDVLMNALDSKIDGTLMMMYKIVDELTKIKVHLSLSSTVAGETSKVAATDSVPQTEKEKETEEEEEEDEETEKEEEESDNEDSSNDSDGKGGSKEGNGDNMSDSASEQESQTPTPVAPAKGKAKSTKEEKKLSRKKKLVNHLAKRLKLAKSLLQKAVLLLHLS